MILNFRSSSSMDTSRLRRTGATRFHQQNTTCPNYGFSCHSLVHSFFLYWSWFRKYMWPKQMSVFLITLWHVVWNEKSLYAYWNTRAIMRIRLENEAGAGETWNKKHVKCFIYKEINIRIQAYRWMEEFNFTNGKLLLTNKIESIEVPDKTHFLWLIQLFRWYF